MSPTVSRGLKQNLDRFELVSPPITLPEQEKVDNIDGSMTTPMMLQWQSCKEKAPEAFLLFRLGDFYEAFHTDAETIAKELNLTLTARQGIPMCGVPFHAAENYIDKLLAKGFKVAIAEQTEDPKAVPHATKGLVKREITRIITPGTLVTSQLLSDKKNNFFASLSQVGQVFGMSVLDVTTGEFRAIELEQEAELLDELVRLKPAEFLVDQNFAFFKELSYSFTFIVTKRDRIEPKKAFETLLAQVKSEKISSMPAAAQAAGSLLLYFRELRMPIDHIVNLQTDSLLDYMAIDRATLCNLELIEPMSEATKAYTLLSLLDETQTAMGARLLAQWIQRPLLNVKKIQLRQEAIALFLEAKQDAKRLRELLEPIRDLERLIMKISAQYATPRDVLGLGLSLAQIDPIRELLAGRFPMPPFAATALAQHIKNALNESPPLRIGEGDIFKDGYHTTLDELRFASRESTRWMSQYQTTLREETGIKTLKVGYTKAFGYYIEVSHAQSGKIPETFQRRQTLVNAERFITEELKRFEHQVLTAEERAKGLEAQLFEELRLKIAEEAPAIRAVAKAIAALDALLSLAKVAQDRGYVRPLVDDSNRLEILEGRHPSIEKAIGVSSFIPNDTILNPDQQLMLITGPNMAGKSTYIRQVALIAILAQIGSYVPAKQAHVGLIDQIFSRIGASDDLARGQSTFMVEMSETAHILNHVSSRSLVLLDEIGRGTSTYDGISIAWAVAEYLLTTQGKQAKTLFATHYWELTRLEEEFSHAKNFQIAVQEIPSGIVFLRKILRGGTDKSYGIHVAKLAGLPAKAIQRAEQMLAELETKAPKKKTKALLSKDEQLALI
jgi:DNA mismatch repair protein MutS